MYILHHNHQHRHKSPPILVPQTGFWIVSASSYHPMTASWHSDRASPVSDWPHDMIWVLHCSRPVLVFCALPWSALVTQPWLAGASRGKWPWAPLVACDMCPASGGGSVPGRRAPGAHVASQCHQHPMSHVTLGTAVVRTHSPADQIDITSVHHVGWWEVWGTLFCSWHGHPLTNPHPPSHRPYCEQHIMQWRSGLV